MFAQFCGWQLLFAPLYFHIYSHSLLNRIWLKFVFDLFLILMYIKTIGNPLTHVSPVSSQHLANFVLIVEFSFSAAHDDSGW